MATEADAARSRGNRRQATYWKPKPLSVSSKLHDTWLPRLLEPLISPSLYPFFLRKLPLLEGAPKRINCPLSADIEYGPRILSLTRFPHRSRERLLVAGQPLG